MGPVLTWVIIGELIAMCVVMAGIAAPSAKK